MHSLGQAKALCRVEAGDLRVGSKWEACAWPAAGHGPSAGRAACPQTREGRRAVAGPTTGASDHRRDRCEPAVRGGGQKAQES